jgi:hypothetical protein
MEIDESFRDDKSGGFDMVHAFTTSRTLGALASRSRLGHTLVSRTG